MSLGLLDRIVELGLGLELAVVLTSMIESGLGLCVVLVPGTKVFRHIGQEAC